MRVLLEAPVGRNGSPWYIPAVWTGRTSEPPGTVTLELRVGEVSFLWADARLVTDAEGQPVYPTAEDAGVQSDA